MRRIVVSIPELFVVAGTRLLGGVGVGLLLADRLATRRRRQVGVALLTIGVATTLPLARRILPRAIGRRAGRPADTPDPLC